MKKKITIYETRDRQGVKHFSKKPVFESGFDFFSGVRIELPKNREDYRLVRKFKTKVTGRMAEDGFYPKEIQVG